MLKEKPAVCLVRIIIKKIQNFFQIIGKGIHLLLNKVANSLIRLDKEFEGILSLDIELFLQLLFFNRIDPAFD